MMEWVFGVSGNPNCMKTVIGFFFLDQFIILVMHCDVIFGKLQKRIKSKPEFKVIASVCHPASFVVVSWVCCCFLGLLLHVGSVVASWPQTIDVPVI